MSRLVLFNKPFQVLCQFTDEKNSDAQRRKTLADFIDVPKVYVAGRLDFDSEGLLALTDNGKLQHKIANPKNKMAKTYWVQVEGIPSQESLDQLMLGVKLKDGMTKPAKVKLINEPKNLWPRDPPIRVRKNIPDQWLSITIKEGKNRQVRRMTAAIGHPTLRLIRYSIGHWSIDNLALGEYRIIDK